MTAFDLDALIDQDTRRQVALASGSTHIPLALRSQSGPRPDAVSPLDRPELLWPSERHLVPRQCPNCGVNRANFQTDAPYGLVRRGQITCWVCSQTVVRLKADGSREIVGRPVRDPEAERLCKDCGERPIRPNGTTCLPCERRANAHRPCVECGGKRVPYSRRCREHETVYRRTLAVRS